MRERTATYIRTRHQYQFFRAFIIGILAGALALLFQYSLWLGEVARNSLLGALPHNLWWRSTIILTTVGAIGALVAWFTARLAPEAAGSGIPHVKTVLAGTGQISGVWLIPVKFVGGVLAISAGFSLGREGPTVQMGAVTGSRVARFLGLSRGERNHLIACGAGAGLAGAFNAPLAGFLFVIEEFGRELTPMTYGTAFISSLTASLVTQVSLGQIPSFHISQYATSSLNSLPLFLLLGITAGVFGSMFNSSLLFLRRQGQRWSGNGVWKKGAIAGLAVGLGLLFLPEATGGGHSTAEIFLRGQFPLHHTVWFLFTILFAKLLLTNVCFASGVPGGIFAPMLMMGSVLGSLVGYLGSMLFPTLVPTPAAFAVVGMAAMFVASVRAPLTGMVLILEMTGNYSQLFPLSVACLVSYLTSTALRNPAIYEALSGSNSSHTEYL
jgi:CIC family chloride channel protein